MSRIRKLFQRGSGFWKSLNWFLDGRPLPFCELVSGTWTSVSFGARIDAFTLCFSLFVVGVGTSMVTALAPRVVAGRWYFVSGKNNTEFTISSKGIQRKGEEIAMKVDNMTSSYTRTEIKVEQSQKLII